MKDAAGRPVVGEVTLWAVDYGVLSLTDFQTPDVLRSVYRPKALQVFTEDNRQRLVTRRALVPKGAGEGGGGGADAGAGTLRRDFRVLAFWIGSTVTNAEGRATAELKLPESLTTYRIMAVAGRQGVALRLGRTAKSASTSRSRCCRRSRASSPSAIARSSARWSPTSLRSAGQAVVTIRSLDPGPAPHRWRLDQSRRRLRAGARAKSRFTATARGVGRARVQMTVRLNGETDAYEEVVPVVVLTPHETVAAYGQTQATASETLVDAARRRARLRRIDGAARLDGARRTRRRRALPRRVSVRLRRTEGLGDAAVDSRRRSR